MQPSLRLASTLKYAGQSSAKARISDRILHVHVPRLMHPASAISSATWRRGLLTSKTWSFYFISTSSPPPVWCPVLSETLSVFLDPFVVLCSEVLHMRAYLVAGLSRCRTQYDGSVLGSILVLEVHGFQTPGVPMDSRWFRDNFERPKVLGFGSYIQYA